MKNPKLIVIFSGLFLMIVGVGLILVQFYFQISAPEIIFPQRGANLEAVGVKAGVATTYVGLVLVVVGAFLEIVGYIFGKSSDDKNT
jgi:uncharacterized membrane protein